MSNGMPQGAISGENPTAQDIYEKLKRGEMPNFATRPDGVQIVVAPTASTVEEPRVGRKKLGLGGFRKDMAELRKAIDELTVIIKQLQQDLQ